MIYGEASVTVAAAPAQVLELICDIERYKLADTKIRKVLETKADGDQIVVRFRSRLRGLPTPAVRQRVARTGDDRVDITSVPSWADRLVDFRGSVTCTPTAAGTHVVHREEFHPHGLLQPVFERFLGRWLARDIDYEVARLGQLLDEPASAPPEASS
ncbi:MAG: SRPBCC family protein [Streptosporangiaceae bacterium]